MKILPPLLATGSAMLLISCVDPYYAGEAHLHPVEPRVIGGEPVVVERYSETSSQPRPYYGDPVPSTTYRRTTTRTYQGY